MNNIRCVFLVLFTLVITSSTASLAQSKDALPDDILSYEGIGVYKAQKDGAFGDGLWKKSSRKDIATLIHSMPVTSDSYTVQRLIRAILLGQSSTDDLKDADAISSDTDLLTLRLQHLVDGGLYDDALALYSLLEAEQVYPAIRRLGLIAMMGSGEKSYACLDIKGIDDEHHVGEFWNQIRAYCDVNFSASPSDASKDHIRDSVLSANTYDYDMRKFEALSAIERATLIANGVIKASNMNSAQVNALPTAHVSALMRSDMLSDNLLNALFIRAAEIGVIDSSTLGDYYAGLSGDALSGFKLGQLYQTLKQPKADTNRGSVLAEALKESRQYSNSALLPFLPYFEALSDDELTHSNILDISRIYHRSKTPIPNELAEKFVTFLDKNSKNIEKYTLTQAIKLLSNSGKSYRFVKDIPNSHLFHKYKHYSLINVIENLDNTSHDVDNAAIVYEKDYLSSGNNVFYMPPKPLWDRMNEASKDKILGETILLSIYALRGAPVHNTYPEVFADLVQNLDNVGLKTFSRDLVIEAMLGASSVSR